MHATSAIRRRFDRLFNNDAPLCIFPTIDSQYHFFSAVSYFNVGLRRAPRIHAVLAPYGLYGFVFFC